MLAKTRAEAGIDRTLMAICALGTHDKRARVRCNIMLHDPEQRQLRIRYYRGEYTLAELNLVWAPGQGIAGHVFRSGETLTDGAMEDLSQSPLAQAKRYEDIVGDRGEVVYQLTEEQWLLTRHLGAVVSIPLRVRGSVRGVLNVDDLLPLADSPLSSNQARSTIMGLRAALEADLAVLLP